MTGFLLELVCSVVLEELSSPVMLDIALVWVYASMGSTYVRIGTLAVTIVMCGHCDSEIILISC